MTDRVYFMSKGGDGLEDPPSQVHLPDGSMLRPISSTSINGITASTFAFPAKWRNAAIAMGFEATNPSIADPPIEKFIQGPTSARPTGVPNNFVYYDTTLARFVLWNSTLNTWLVS